MVEFGPIVIVCPVVKELRCCVHRYNDHASCYKGNMNCVLEEEKNV